MQTTRLLFRSPQARFVPHSSLRAFSASAPIAQRVIEGIKHDHRELEGFKNNIMISSSNEDKTRWQNQFTWELARHSIAEELVVYPAMEKYIPGGRNMADKDRTEHQHVKDLLYKFQNLNPADKDFEPTLKTLWNNLSQHIREEEEHDLPELEKHMKAEDSDTLHNSFERTKMFVPTRSHPSAPDKPPFETVAGLMAAPLDKLGDMFRKFPNRSVPVQ